jgi:hypothetical protein
MCLSLRPDHRWHSQVNGTHPVKAAETVIGSDFDCD